MSRKKSSIEHSFSRRLKILIENNLKISQVNIANKIGISQSYLSAVLKNKRGPSAELIAGLFVHYREYLDWLLTGEGEMVRKPENPDTDYTEKEDDELSSRELYEDVKKLTKKVTELEIENKNLRNENKDLDKKVEAYLKETKEWNAKVDKERQRKRESDPDNFDPSEMRSEHFLKPCCEDL